MKTIAIFILILALSSPSPAMTAEHGHDHEATGHAGEHADKHEETKPISLTPEQIRQAGITTVILHRTPASTTISAPGIVTANAYALADITAVVDGIIRQRYVHLGDRVEKGQALVTLTSPALAQGQADYLRAEAEHRTRKQELDRLGSLVKEKIISQARFQQAFSAHQAAHANLAAAQAVLASYGLSAETIDALIKSSQYGLLTLFAPHSGTVMVDDFLMGQHIAAGTRLMQIVDESSVWVEAKLSQSQMHGIKAGGKAMVTGGEQAHPLPGVIINTHHQLDAATRTAGVRLEVQNPEDTLHPGMFVSAEIATGAGEKSLLLPEGAVQRQGSELIVFVEEEPGHFERREVQVGQVNMGLVSIVEGLKEGESVVVKGAFVLVSELAKSGFEAHNH